MASTRAPSATAAADNQRQLQLAPSRAAAIAPAGVIRGGQYDGCRYVLLELRAVRGRTVPFVRCERWPGWPFPREILVKPPAKCEADA